MTERELGRGAGHPGGVKPPGSPFAGCLGGRPSGALEDGERPSPPWHVERELRGDPGILHGEALFELVRDNAASVLVEGNLYTANGGLDEPASAELLDTAVWVERLSPDGARVLNRSFLLDATDSIWHWSNRGTVGLRKDGSDVVGPTRTTNPLLRSSVTSQYGFAAFVAHPTPRMRLVVEVAHAGWALSGPATWSFNATLRPDDAKWVSQDHRWLSGPRHAGVLALWAGNLSGSEVTVHARSDTVARGDRLTTFFETTSGTSFWLTAGRGTLGQMSLTARHNASPSFSWSSTAPEAGNFSTSHYADAGERWDFELSYLGHGSDRDGAPSFAVEPYFFLFYSEVPGPRRP